MPAGKRRRINWLEALDSLSTRLPRARSWINYPYFFFARYPQLQPADSADRKHQLHLEIGRKTFQEELQKWESRFAGNEIACRVLEGLDSGRRTQLAGLMIDCLAEIGDYVNRIPYHKLLKKWASQAPHRERMLKRKLATVHKALDDLMCTLTSVGPSQERLVNSRIKAYERAVENLENYLKKIAPFLRPRHLLGDILREPASITLPDLEGLLNTPGFHVVPENPVAPCMIKLYWFFHHGCGISGNQSEVRVALLRNTFWRNARIPTVKCKEIAGAEGSAECGAVKRAVQRYSTKLPSE